MTTCCWDVIVWSDSLRDELIHRTWSDTEVQGCHFTLSTVSGVGFLEKLIKQYENETFINFYSDSAGNLKVSERS